MDKISAEDKKQLIMPFSQAGEKNTSIGTANNVTINNLTKSNDEKFITSAIVELEILRKKIHLYEELGIINCTEELKGTQLEPIQCMKDVHTSLSFMGVGGEKWVKDVQLRKAFENMLRRTKSMGGKVRFLLINPASEAYSRLYQLRGESVPFDSYERFANLVNKFDNLKVRLYSDMPSFRMQFVDDTYLAISRYYFDKVSHDSFGGGWKTPHLIISSEQKEFGENESKHKGSLYGSFWLSYNFIWAHSDDVQQWINGGKIFNK
ncbi:hypothetical protein D7X87_25300 [bacterium D16-54]|nr:hypothetical protein D7X87_25300 [bacterium D16-54]RKJ09436.1 hypothetical protein D7X65_25395 [bacterium D16-56]